MTQRLDPAVKFQNAEARACECGAAGSGEGHADFCPWLEIEAEAKARLFGRRANSHPSN